MEPRDITKTNNGLTIEFKFNSGLTSLNVSDRRFYGLYLFQYIH